MIQFSSRGIDSGDRESIDLAVNLDIVGRKPTRSAVDNPRSCNTMPYAPLGGHNMASALEPHLRLAVGHILFLDIVGYSKLLADEQKELIQELNRGCSRDEAIPGRRS